MARMLMNCYIVLYCKCEAYVDGIPVKSLHLEQLLLVVLFRPCAGIFLLARSFEHHTKRTLVD